LTFQTLNSKIFFDSKILILLNSIGVSLLGLTYIMAYKGSFYNSLFWSSVLLMGIAFFTFALKDDTINSNKVIFLIIFGAELFLLRFIASTNHFHFYDEIMTFESTKLMYESGSINVTPKSLEILRYYPGLEILTIFLKYFSNLSMFSISMVLIGTISSIVPVVAYLFFKQISSSSRISFIGALIYASSPMHVFFHNIYSYESLGIFLVLLLFYVLSKSSIKRASLEFQVVEIIIMCALVITHHYSSFMLVLFMIILVIISRYIPNIFASHKYYFNSFLLASCLFFGWMTYVANIAYQYLFKSFTIRFFKIFELSTIGKTTSNVQLNPFVLSLMPSYESFINNYIYPPLTLLLAFLGTYYIYKKNKVNAFTNTTFFYGPLFYLLSFGLIITSGQELAVRTWGFLFIGLSFFIAVTLDHMITKSYRVDVFRIKINTRTLASISFILLFISGISLGDKPIHRVPDLLNPKLVSGTGSITSDVITAADWFENHFGRDNTMTGDISTSIVFRGDSENLEMLRSWKAFIPTSLDNSSLNYLNTENINYIISDERMTDRFAENGHYFDGYESYQDIYPNYGSTQFLPKESLAKFHKSGLFVPFYNNGNIIIYKYNRL
jgi:hypothetical protein